MKTYSRLCSVALVILLLSACNGTFQVGIDYSPARTAASQAPVLTDPKITPTPVISTPTATLEPPRPTDTPVIPTDTPVVPPPTPGPQMVQIYLVAVGDNGQSGALIGCGDSLVPVQYEITPTQGVLRASLQALLSLKDQFYGQSGLYNALYQSNLQLDNVTLSGGQAVIDLSGSMTLAGECDNPRVSAQLEATARQFPSVTDVKIYLNGKLIADALSLKGQ